MRITWFFLLLISFNVCKENETDALIARMIEGGINLGIDAGLKLIKIPVFIGGKIVWKTVKVNAKFLWSLSKIPVRVLIRLARKLAKKPLKLITAIYLQHALKQSIKEHRRNQKMRKKKKSIFHRMKASINNTFKNSNHEVTDLPKTHV